jgi:hypothetical protein
MTESDAAPWPKVGDPPIGFEHAPDCPAVTLPDADLPQFPVYCTRSTGHAPPHVAEGIDRIVHVWVGDDDLRAAALANPDAALALFAFLLGEPDPNRSE